MIETKSPELKKAVCIVRELSQDEETRLQFEAREKARMDYEDRMDGAFERGLIKKGIEDIIILVSKYNIPLNTAMSDFDLDISYKSQIIDELNKRNIKYDEQVNEIIDGKGTRKKPVATYKKLTPAEEEKLLFEAREKARMDYEDRMDGAFARGFAKGWLESYSKDKIVEGKVKGVVELIKRNNFDLDFAMQSFGLDKKYRAQIVDELDKRNINYIQ